MTYDLEPLTEADAAFRWEVFAATIKPMVERATGLTGETLRKEIANQLRSGTHQAIVKGGVRVGVLQIEESATSISLSQIEILPQFQGLGIGTTIIESLIARSERAQLPLELSVFRENTRAQALYARHGFEVVDERDHDLRMVRQPGSH